MGDTTCTRRVRGPNRLAGDPRSGDRRCGRRCRGAGLHGELSPSASHGPRRAWTYRDWITRVSTVAFAVRARDVVVGGGLVSALSPAIRSLRTDTNSDLKASAGGHTHTGGSQGSLLLTAEVALSTDGADRRRHAGAQFSEPPCGRSWVYRKRRQCHSAKPDRRAVFRRCAAEFVCGQPCVSSPGAADGVCCRGREPGPPWRRRRQCNLQCGEGTTLPRLERPVVAPIVADPA